MGFFPSFTRTGFLDVIMLQPAVLSKYFSNSSPVYDKKYDNPIDSASRKTEQMQEQEKLKSKFTNWLNMLRFSGRQVPENIRDDHMNTLFENYQRSRSQAIIYLRFLFVTENKHACVQQEKLEKRLEREKVWSELNQVPDEKISYGLWRESMIGRTHKQTMSNWYYHKLSNALRFGQPLVIDCGFDCHKLRKEQSSFRKEMQLSVKLNMEHINPFNLHICNFSDVGLNLIKNHTHVLNDPVLPMNVTSKSYLDLFPRDKLVYLTPDSRSVIKSFDRDKVYIIGGIVDLSEAKPLSQSKAKREQIPTMKLPLHDYPEFKFKKRALGIHVMVAILLELQKSGDFLKAFEYIPKHMLHKTDYKLGDSPWDNKNAQRTLNALSPSKGKKRS